MKGLCSQRHARLKKCVLWTLVFGCLGLTLTGSVLLALKPWSQLVRWYPHPSVLCPAACRKLASCTMYESYNWAAADWSRTVDWCTFSPCTCPVSPCSSCDATVHEHRSDPFCFANEMIGSYTVCKNAAGIVADAFYARCMPMVVVGAVGTVGFLILLALYRAVPPADGTSYVRVDKSGKGDPTTGLLTVTLASPSDDVASPTRSSGGPQYGSVDVSDSMVDNRSTDFTSSIHPHVDRPAGPRSVTVVANLVDPRSVCRKCGSSTAPGRFCESCGAARL
jgi:hypothetical protein